MTGAPPGRGQVAGGSQAAQEDSADGHAARCVRPGTGPSRLGQGGDDEAERGQEQGQSSASTTRRLLNRDSMTWATVPTANRPNTMPPWTAWLP